jgi:ferric-dicitrate binding protein FerR (iron transport regulator)
MDKDYLVNKWLNGELSEVEMNEFQALEEYPVYKDIVDNAKFFKASEFSEVPDFDSFRKRLQKSTNSELKLYRRQWLLRIASIFVIGFALYYFFLFNPTTEIRSEIAQKITIELPDASTVVLNAQSEIRYSKKDWNRNREVKLAGEAYFKVAKGATFDVLTTEGTVSVVGTQFNVRQRGAIFEVRCYEGVVKVTTHGTSELLEAGDSFILQDGKPLLGSNVYQHPQWTRDISEFQRSKFIDVIAELERQYSIRVTIEDDLGKILFTGGFVHDNLENALRSITEPMNLEYKITDINQVSLTKRED